MPLPSRSEDSESAVTCVCFGQERLHRSWPELVALFMGILWEKNMGSIYIYICAFIYIYIFVYTYICIYLFLHIHIYTHVVAIMVCIWWDPLLIIFINLCNIWGWPEMGVPSSLFIGISSINYPFWDSLIVGNLHIDGIYNGIYLYHGIIGNIYPVRQQRSLPATLTST